MTEHSDRQEDAPGQTDSGNPAELRAALRARRSECYLSHADAATLAGVSISTIKAMEGPRGHLTVKTLRALERGYGLAPTDMQTGSPPQLRPVLSTRSVKALAQVLIPAVEAGGAIGERALIDYYAVVDALAKGDAKPTASLDSLIELARNALAPADLVEVIADLREGFGTTPPDTPPRSVESPVNPMHGPTPAQLGAIINSGLPADTQQRLFGLVTRRNSEAIAAVERELETLIYTLRQELNQHGKI